MLLRPAEPGDAMAVARVHVRSWQAAYRGLIPDDYLGRLRAEDRAPRYDFSHIDPLKPHTTVAVEGKEIWGFVTVAPSSGAELKGFGELSALYVDPDRWAQGLGTALLRAGRARLKNMGFSRAYLWVLKGNHRAAHFYAKDRWTRDGAQRLELVWNLMLEEERYRRRLE